MSGSLGRTTPTGANAGAVSVTPAPQRPASAGPVTFVPPPPTGPVAEPVAFVPTPQTRPLAGPVAFVPAAQTATSPPPDGLLTGRVPSQWMSSQLADIAHRFQQAGAGLSQARSADEGVAILRSAYGGFSPREAGDRLIYAANYYRADHSEAADPELYRDRNALQKQELTIFFDTQRKATIGAVDKARENAKLGPTANLRTFRNDAERNAYLDKLAEEVTGDFHNLLFGFGEEYIQSKPVAAPAAPRQPNPRKAA